MWNKGSQDGKEEVRIPQSLGIPQQCLLPSGGIKGELLGLVPACLFITVGSLDKTGAAYLKARRCGCGIGEAGPWSWHMWPWYLTCLISSDTTVGFCGHTPE